MACLHPFLSISNAKTLFHGFIITCIDYWITVTPFSLPSMLSPYKSTFITWRQLEFMHQTLTSTSLTGWKFKILLLTFKAQHNLVLFYPREPLTPYSLSLMLSVFFFFFAVTSSVFHAPDFPPWETGPVESLTPALKISPLISMWQHQFLYTQVWFKGFSFSWTFLSPPLFYSYKKVTLGLWKKVYTGNCDLLLWVTDFFPFI